jgi:ferrous iron transport protein A
VILFLIIITSTVNSMAHTAEIVDQMITRVRDLPLGTTAKVVRVEGGSGMNRKLLGLGLRVGSVIEMVHRRGQGVVIANSGNRIALGSTVADRIWAEPVDDTRH